MSYTGTVVSNNIDYTKYLKFTVHDYPNGASERERTEDVRKNATAVAISQNRSVTVRDYIYILENVFYNFVLYANAWDINDLSDAGLPFTVFDLGLVNICVIPQNYRERNTLTQFDTNTILKKISKDYIVGGIRLEWYEPEYIIVDHAIDVYYDEIKRDIELNVLLNNIKTVVRSVYDAVVVKFNTYLPLSRVQAAVDSVDRCIVTTKIVTSLRVKLKLESGVRYNKTYRFGFELTPGTLTIGSKGLSDKNGLIVNSSDVQYGTVDYATGVVSINIPADDITLDEVVDFKFNSKDPYISVINQYVIIDGDEYTWNLIKV
jgi:hypothetical protein